MPLLCVVVPGEVHGSNICVVVPGEVHGSNICVVVPGEVHGSYICVVVPGEVHGSKIFGLKIFGVKQIFSNSNKAQYNYDIQFGRWQAPLKPAYFFQNVC